jgi:predicted metal-dependent enzyme (double-stranded beta helix superfamily)
VSTPTTLEGFVAALRAIPRDQFSDEKVLATVRAHPVPASELEPYVVWKPDRYTRSLIYRDDLFMVLALSWNVGQASPVHDHAGQRCWMVLPQGRLEVANYSFKHGREAEYLDTEVVGSDPTDVHVDQCCSIHQITNRCAWCEPAISLHVYSRPFDSCYIYDLARGTRDLRPLCCDFYGPMAQEFAGAG